MKYRILSNEIEKNERKMGKSMSTAKQINRSTVIKVAKESPELQPNQQTIRRGNKILRIKFKRLSNKFLLL